jgi:thioredoxin reductase (NADPH)
VLVIVDDEDASRHALARELESRYGAHYRIVPSPSPETALARLTELRAQGVATVRGGHRDREEPSVRTHEIRDILARNSIPFGFYRSDSAEGRQALVRLGVDQPAGPVVALFNSIVLVDPGNAEVAEALGSGTGTPAGPSRSRPRGCSS